MMKHFKFYTYTYIFALSAENTFPKSQCDSQLKVFGLNNSNKYHHGVYLYMLCLKMIVLPLYYAVGCTVVLHGPTNTQRLEKAN